jgi:hypothetical protein
MKLQVLALALGLALLAATFWLGSGDCYWIQLSGWGPGSQLRATQPMNGPASLAPATMEIGGGTIHVAFAPGHFSLPQAVFIGWVSAAARAVTTYYGRFPVPKAKVLIVPVEHRDGVLSGTSWGTRPVSTRIYVGASVDNGQLDNDWIMTHEMVHYAFPSMPEEHHWIEEGIATYVEPLARLETGEIRVAEVWGALIEGLPFGLAGPGDEGLDHTHTWGRTYWGGAMFCLLADVRIRRQTNDRYGLCDALRAIVNGGGNMETTWPLTDALEVGDRAVGAPVLMQLYEEMKATPANPDLSKLWSRLGIERDRKTITFDETAPWASTRRAIAADKLNR